LKSQILKFEIANQSPTDYFFFKGTSKPSLFMSMIGNYRRLSEEDLDEILQEPESILNALYPEDSDIPDGSQLDIDKAWHLIHFLLTGEPWEGAEPLCNAVLGGAEIDEEDVGYGPARYLTSTEVNAVATALASISPEELWTRFDLAKVHEADIYPSSWEGNDSDRDYILSYFNDLKAFFTTAQQQHDCMILYLN
jgi:hypothetical protein